MPSNQRGPFDYFVPPESALVDSLLEVTEGCDLTLRQSRMVQDWLLRFAVVGSASASDRRITAAERNPLKRVGKRGSGRFERVDGLVVAMAPERASHAKRKSQAWLVLRQAVAAAGLSCEVYPDGMTVEVGESDDELQMSNCQSTSSS